MSEENSENDTTENQDIPKEYGVLIKNSFFSFLNTYGTFIFSIISSFLLARLIGDVSWNYFILGISYIQIVSLIIKFLPPSLNNTLQYYIPRLSSLKENNRLKSFVLRAIFAKVIFLIPIFIIAVVFFSLFSNIFLINLPEENHYVVLLLSPLIIINNLQVVLNSINIGFNRFKTVFLTFLTQYLIYIAFLLYYFIFFQSIELGALAIIYVCSALIPFLMNIFIVVSKIYKIKISSKSSTSIKDDFQDMVRYGGLTRTATFFTEMWAEIQVQSIGFFRPESVLGFQISRNLLSVSVNASTAIANPLTVSFSSFIAKEEKENITAIYNLIIKYLIFFMEILTGLLFFLADFFIAFIYGEPRLIFSDIVKLYLFTFIFLIVSSPMVSLLLAENKGKSLVLVRFIGFLLQFPLFLVLLVFFDLYYAIFGIIISNLLFSVLYLYVTIKIGNIKLKIKKIFFQYLIFFISLGLTLILEYFLLDNLNNLLLLSLNPPLFSVLNLFSIIVFLFVFMFLVIEFRVLTVGDINNLQSFFFKKSTMHKITNRVLNFLKKILKE
jgi:O-antigen/teichoic acid export membrane protein